MRQTNDSSNCRVDKTQKDDNLIVKFSDNVSYCQVKVLGKVFIRIKIRLLTRQLSRGYKSSESELIASQTR